MFYDPSEIILYVSRKLNDLKIEHFIIGATARDLLCKEQNISAPLRKTNDVDFGILINSWSKHKELENVLSSDPNINKVNEIKYTCGDKVFDLVAFGKIEDENKNVSIPPDYSTVMNMAGFYEAYENAMSITIKGSSIKVVTPEMLVSLKIVSWNDRNSRWKDMEDIKLILNHAENLYPELPDELWGKHSDLMREFDHSIELASVAYIGRKASHRLDQQSKDLILRILQSNKEKVIIYFQIDSQNNSKQNKIDAVFNAFIHGFEN